MNQFSVYDKEAVKLTMLHQEAIFKTQVEELHRLYNRQKDMLMIELQQHKLGKPLSENVPKPETVSSVEKAEGQLDLNSGTSDADDAHCDEGSKPLSCCKCPSDHQVVPTTSVSRPEPNSGSCQGKQPSDTEPSPLEFETLDTGVSDSGAPVSTSASCVEEMEDCMLKSIAETLLSISDAVKPRERQTGTNLGLNDGAIGCVRGSTSSGERKQRTNGKLPRLLEEGLTGWGKNNKRRRMNRNSARNPPLKYINANKES